MNSLHVTGLAVFVWRFWLMKPPVDLTKGKDGKTFSGYGLHSMFRLEFFTKLPSCAAISQNFSTYVEREDLVPSIIIL